VKFGRVVFELCERTIRQIGKQTYSSQNFAPLWGRGNNLGQGEMTRCTIIDVFYLPFSADNYATVRRMLCDKMTQSI